MPNDFPQTMIRVAGERKAQLEQFAASQGVSMSAALGKLVKAIQDQGLIDHDIPGVRIDRLADGLAVAFDDHQPTGFSQDAALQLAAVVRSFVDGTERSKTVASVDNDYVVSRRGSAFTVLIPFVDGVTKTWGADLALEFADLLEATAHKA